MNIVLITGNLTKDPDLTKATSGLDVCKFSIAVNEIKAKNDTRELESIVQYFNIVAFSSVAKSCYEHLKKGSKVLVNGRLEINNIVQANGERKTYCTIIAKSVEFLTTNKNNNINNNSNDIAQQEKELEDELPF